MLQQNGNKMNEANQQIEQEHIIMERAIAARSLRECNNDFNQRLKEILAGDHKNKNPLSIGLPSPCLLDCGFPNVQIEITVRKLTEKMNQPNHPFSILSVLHMPECVGKPIAVFQSVGKVNSKVILTEMVDGVGVNLIVAIELGKTFNKKTVNDIRSVYPKDNIGDIVKWIREYDLMEYCDKEKALDWIGKQQSIPAEVTKLVEGFTNVYKSK